MSAAAGPSLLEGALLAGGGVLLATTAARQVERAIGTGGLAAFAAAVALKPAFALRALVEAATQVERALACGELGTARRLLGRHLVSRDTRQLSQEEVAGAVIESLAENVNDSVIAPFLAYRAGGLGAAYGYRLVNTADAMIGYRTPELEWFGKAAARADDVAGWIPARLSALLVACAAPLGGGSPRRALRIALRDAARTPSPNAGWPMAAMAGALGVRLTKRDAYELHADGRAPTAHDIRRARHVVVGAAVVAALAVDAT